MQVMGKGLRLLGPSLQLPKTSQDLGRAGTEPESRRPGRGMISFSFRFFMGLEI